MTRTLFAAVLLFMSTGVSAAPVPKVTPDPLPKGATARLGANAFRGPVSHGLTFSPDGKKLIAWANKGGSDFFRDDRQQLLAWDVESGQALAQKFTVPRNLVRFKDDSGTVRSALRGDRFVWLTPSRTRDTAAEAVVADWDGNVIERVEFPGRHDFGALRTRDEFSDTAVASSGRYMATYIEDGREIEAYNIQTGKRVLSATSARLGRPRFLFPHGRDTLYAQVPGGPVRRFDLSSGKELPELADSPYEGLVAESPDGKRIASRALVPRTFVDGEWHPEDCKVDVRDGATGKRLGRFDVPQRVEALAFAGPETLIVHAGTFSRWNVVTRKREWEVPAGGSGIVVSPDNKRFATAIRHRVLLYEVRTGERLVDPNGHSGPVDWVAFSADGKTVTTAGPGEIITWALTGTRLRTVVVPELRQVAPPHVYRGREPRGDFLVWPLNLRADPAGTIVGWDREKGSVAWRVAGVPHSSQVYTPDGKRLICIRLDPKNPADDIVTVYDGPSGKKEREWSCPRPKTVHPQHWPRAVCSEGRFVVIGGDSPVRILDAETGKEHARVATDATNVRGPLDDPPTVAVSADGSKLAVLSGTATNRKVEIYDAGTGKLQAAHKLEDFPPEVLRFTPGGKAFVPPGMMKFSPNGKALAIWHSPGAPQPQGSTTLVWEFGAANAAPKPLVAEPWAGTSCAAFSPDGKTLAVGYEDGTALLWDLTAK